MQVMLLIYGEEAAWAALPPEQKGAMFGAHQAYIAALREAGAFLSGNQLMPGATARTARAGAVLDGPYAETREQLGGYYLIEVPDMEAAGAWAARCPILAGGAVEARPVVARG